MELQPFYILSYKVRSTLALCQRLSQGNFYVGIFFIKIDKSQLYCTLRTVNGMHCVSKSCSISPVRMGELWLERRRLLLNFRKTRSKNGFILNGPLGDNNSQIRTCANLHASPSHHRCCWSISLPRFIQRLKVAIVTTPWDNVKVPRSDW